MLQATASRSTASSRPTIGPTSATCSSISRPTYDAAFTWRGVEGRDSRDADRARHLGRLSGRITNVHPGSAACKGPLVLVWKTSPSNAEPWLQRSCARSAIDRPLLRPMQKLLRTVTWEDVHYVGEQASLNGCTPGGSRNRKGPRFDCRGRSHRAQQHARQRFHRPF